MSHSYYYTECHTFRRLLIGEGRSSWQYWGLFDHQGVTVNLRNLGFVADNYRFLPRSLLKRLYDNFNQVYDFKCVLTWGELDEFLADGKYTDEQRDSMHDNRSGFFTIDVYEDEEGYPHLLPLLPELADRSILERISKDPSLDMQLFNSFLDKGLLSRVWEHQHGRWSQEWVNFCKNLVEKHPQKYAFFDEI